MTQTIHAFSGIDNVLQIFEVFFLGQNLGQIALYGILLEKNMSEININKAKPKQSQF